MVYSLVACLIGLFDRKAFLDGVSGGWQRFCVSGGLIGVGFAIVLLYKLLTISMDSVMRSSTEGGNETQSILLIQPFNKHCFGLRSPTGSSLGARTIFIGQYGFGFFKTSICVIQI